MPYIKMNEKQLDALREISNIGAGHAATALSQMTGRTIKLKVPHVRSIPFTEVPYVVGGPEALVAGLFLRVYGDTTGNILMIFPAVSAVALAEMLLGKKVDPTLKFSAMEDSVIKEIGNILASSYLGSISQMLNISLIPSVPGSSYDMAGAVIDYILIELSSSGETALLIDTEFIEDSNSINGHFFLIPDPVSLETILKAMAVL